MEPGPMLMSNRIKIAREGLGLSQAELGAAVGVSQTCVWNWEGGYTKPRPKSLGALASILKVSVEHLETGSPVERAGPNTVEGVLDEAKTRLAEILGLPAARIGLRLNIHA
jgi:transcriptional regulator with XRE-family HTH domain